MVGEVAATDARTMAQRTRHGTKSRRAIAEPRFTSAEWAALESEPTKDKLYQRMTRLGPQVADYLAWKEGEDGASPETIRSYERFLARMSWHLSAHQAAQVTPDELRAVRDTFTPKSRHGCTAAFKDFWRWMYEEERIDASPAGRVRFPKKEKAAITDLFGEEEKAAIVTAQHDLRDRACVLLLLRAGLRKGELRALRVKDVNLAEQYALVRRGKGRKARRVPLTGETLNAVNVFLLEDVPGLARPLRPEEYLLYPLRNANQYAGKGERRTPAPWREMANSTAHAWWYRCLQRAGVVDLRQTAGRRMHTTRHTYATDLGRASGWNLLAVQKNLGHASLAMTADTYSQFAFEDQQQAVDLLPDIVTPKGH